MPCEWYDMSLHVSIHLSPPLPPSLPLSLSLSANYFLLIILRKKTTRVCSAGRKKQAAFLMCVCLCIFVYLSVDVSGESLKESDQESKRERGKHVRAMFMSLSVISCVSQHTVLHYLPGLESDVFLNQHQSLRTGITIFTLSAAHTSVLFSSSFLTAYECTETKKITCSVLKYIATR